MEFKDNLKRIREERKLTQEYIADEIGISRQSVSKWEKGQTEPDIETIKRLCLILDCQVTDLIEEPNIKQKESRGKLYTTLFVFGVAFVIAFLTFLVLFIVNITNYMGFYETAKETGLGGVGGYFLASEYNQVALKLGEEAGAADPVLYGATLINTNYTKYGDKFWFNVLGEPPVINWVFLILFISFGVISVCLFMISIFTRRSSKEEGGSNNA